jgi:glycosyltransferase involved in cell wall biosynthesis
LKKNLVVALVCDAIYPYSHGGREFRYQALLPRLAEHIDVHVYTMHWWDGPEVYTRDGITYHAISALLPMYAKGRRSARQALRFGVACLRMLRCHFDVLDADHIPYFQLFVLRLVATLKRKPLVVTWHEVWSRSYWCSYLGWAGWIFWAVESLAMRLPDHIIAASPQTAERLRGIIGEHASITTVPNGTDIAAIAKVRPCPQASDIIAVGRLIEHKRIDALLEVVASLHARGVPVTCRIVGDGPERENLQQKARELKIASAVEFRTDVSEQTELFSLIKAAKLFVFLSAREGFGMAVLEAIACGTRVLTTSAPDNLARHLVERYTRGVVCGPGIDEITNAVQRILALPDQEPAEGSFTDPWVVDYDWETMIERVIEIYADSELVPANGAGVPVLDW